MQTTPAAAGEKDPGLAMDEAQVEGYVEAVLALRDEYKGQIEIALGFEADYIPGYEEEIERIISPYPVDYVYGSVHFLGTGLTTAPTSESSIHAGIQTNYTPFILTPFARLRKQAFSI